MLNLQMIEDTLTKLADIGGLCVRGEEILFAWAQAVISDNAADYALAKNILASALNEHVESVEMSCFP